MALNAHIFLMYLIYTLLHSVSFERQNMLPVYFIEFQSLCSSRMHYPRFALLACFFITNTNIRNIWLDLFFTLSIVIAYLKASACEIPNTIHPSLNSCTKSFGFAPQIRVQVSLIQVFCCLYRLLLSFAILLNTNSSNKQHRPKMKSDLR